MRKLTVVVAAFLLALAFHSATASSPAASPTPGPAESAAKAYVDDSIWRTDRLLEVFQAFMKDPKDMQKGFAIMHAVRAFEAATETGYRAAASAVAADPALAAAVEAFRADQLTLPRRLMNGDEAEWAGMIAESRRLADEVRAPTSGT